MVRRLLISLAGGLLIPVVLFWLLNYVLIVLFESGHERSGHTVGFAFLWPLFLADRIFPQPPSCSSCGPTDASLVTAIIVYFVFYSALTYIIQIMISKLRVGKPRITKPCS
jgi:hypothetical protein